MLRSFFFVCVRMGKRGLCRAGLFKQAPYHPGPVNAQSFFQLNLNDPFTSLSSFGIPTSPLSTSSSFSTCIGSRALGSIHYDLTRIGFTCRFYSRLLLSNEVRLQLCDFQCTLSPLKPLFPSLWQTFFLERVSAITPLHTHTYRQTDIHTYKRGK